MPDSAKTASQGFGIAGLVLGIVGLVLFWFPFLGIVCSILAVIFYFVQRRRSPSGMALAGLILGIVGFVVNVLMILVTIGLLLTMGEVPGQFMMPPGME